MQHLTRALVAAAITCFLVASFYMMLGTLQLWRAGIMPAAAGLMPAAVLRIFGYIFQSLGLVVLAMAPLWFLPTIGPRLARPWTAAIAGATCGGIMALGYLAGMGAFGLHAGRPVTQGEILFYTSMAISRMLPGAIYGALHAFLARHAFAKRAWLASHPLMK